MFALVVCMLGLLVAPALAADDTSYTIYYEDGSYAVITTDSGDVARSTTDKVRSYTYYGPLGQKCFTYMIRGVFTYNGITSHADSCEYSAIIYVRGWDVSTHSEYVSGNTAYGRATFTGPNGQSQIASLTLTCDKNGNVT